MPEERTVPSDPTPAGATATRYLPVQVALHWAVAGLILFQFALSGTMERDFNLRVDGFSPGISLGTLAHMAAGVAIPLAMLLRLWLRLRHGVPPPDPAAGRLVHAASHLTHLALYALTLGMPVAGALAWFGGSEIASELHEIGARLLLYAILLHAAGGLFEHWVMGNDVLVRMLSPGGRRAKHGRDDTPQRAAKRNPSAQGTLNPKITQENLPMTSLHDTREARHSTRRGRPHSTDATLPGQTTLRFFAAAFFTFALIADLAYIQTVVLMWQDFASWMLFAGLVAAGFSVLLWLISLAVYRPVPVWPLLALQALIIALAFVNSLLHAGDGWTAIVPWGVGVSAATVVLMVITGALRRYRTDPPTSSRW